MKIEKIKKNNINIASVKSGECLFTDVQSALDLVMSVQYETECSNITFNKEVFPEDFFILNTCLAGEILSNRGKDIFFVSNYPAAVEILYTAAAMNRRKD